MALLEGFSSQTLVPNQWNEIALTYDGYSDTLQFFHNSNLLINITNDFWFGDYIGPYQHFYLSKLRAAEFNKNLIRVSNNGISSIIDNNGNILVSSELNKKDKLNYKLLINDEKNLIILHKILGYILTIFCFISLFVLKLKDE